jgi:hypothetical protein
MNVKKVIAAGLIVSSLAGAAAASAQSAQTGQLPNLPAPGLMWGFGGVEDLVETYTGLTTAELRDALQGGSTIAELIEANGEDVDAFVTDAVTAREDDLTSAVDEGRITQEQADEIEANLESNITAFVNGEMPQLGAFGRGGFGFGGVGRADLQDLVLTYTGLTADEVRDALQDGSTIADLIEANGQTVDAFTADAAAQIQEQLDTALEDGNITQEQRDDLLATLTDRLTAYVNGELPQMGQFGGRGPMGGQQGFGPGGRGQHGFGGPDGQGFGPQGGRNGQGGPGYGQPPQAPDNGTPLTPPNTDDGGTV